MAKKIGWNSLYSKDSLLARFLSMFYVTPPLLYKAPGIGQRNLMMRFNLPVSRTQRLTGRARDFYENKEVVYIAQPAETSAIAKRDATFASAEDNVVLDAESDPARSAQRASGPGNKSHGNKEFAIFARSIIYSADPANCNCCRCNCDCCRKSAKEWMLPRAAGSCLFCRKEPKLSDKRLQLIRSPGDCVLGVLACGYVLSGSGSVKSRTQKPA